jgi:hypothetical protein
LTHQIDKGFPWSEGREKIVLFQFSVDRAEGDSKVHASREADHRSKVAHREHL